VLDYQIYFIPYISSLIGPFFVLVAVIFFTSQLADRSEIIAILNSGTSFYRMLYPLLLGRKHFGLCVLHGQQLFYSIRQHEAHRL
jgi:lipopolysaccharide export LptBFGC system permease protein LptF